MKFGIMGTHGTGKTTFARDYAGRLTELDNGEKVGLVTGIARLCPWPLNREATEETQRWIFHSHMVAELEATEIYDVVVCDRTALDSLVYADVAGFEDMIDDYLPAALGWLEGYTTIYWFRPADGWLVDDGRRCVDPLYQEAVDQVFENWIRIYGIKVEIVGGEECLKLKRRGGDEQICVL